MKTTVIYHGNCYDGFGAAWAANKKFFGEGQKVEYIPGLYGMEFPFEAWEGNLYILDFSFPKQIIGSRQLVDDYVLNIGEFKVIDHHKTAEADLRDYPGCTIFNMAKSGAVLAWEFFHPGKPVPILLQYVQDRDLWKFEMPFSREIDCYIKSLPFDFRAWDEAEIMFQHHINQIITESKGAYRYQRAMVDVMCNNYVVRNIAGYPVPITNATVFLSEVGEELCKRFPDANFAAYYLDRKDGRRQFGLRSRNGFDVSEVAKKFGGGGHQASAGFVIDLAALEAPWNTNA